MEEQTNRGFAKKGDLAGRFLPFLSQETAATLPAHHILSFFYIFASLLLAPLPAATGRTGCQTETALPFRFGPPAPLAYVRAGTLGGGMRLSSRESLPPQKFISHVDFSFFHSLKLILFLTVSFQR